MPTEAVTSLEAYKTTVDFKSLKQTHPKPLNNPLWGGDWNKSLPEALSNLHYFMMLDHLKVVSELLVVHLCTISSSSAWVRIFTCYKNGSKVWFSSTSQQWSMKWGNSLASQWQILLFDLLNSWSYSNPTDSLSNLFFLRQMKHLFYAFIIWSTASLQLTLSLLLSLYSSSSAPVATS